MIPVASKAVRGLGSSAYSAYKGVRLIIRQYRHGREKYGYDDEYECQNENYDENDA
jgi:hypothetical protein